MTTSLISALSSRRRTRAAKSMAMMMPPQIVCHKIV
jgi:hypothetical protein